MINRKNELDRWGFIRKVSNICQKMKKYCFQFGEKSKSGGIWGGARAQAGGRASGAFMLSNYRKRKKKHYQNLKHGHFYFVRRPKKCEKKRSTKSLLNPHFKGFGAITRSDSCRVLKTVHFGIGDISKCWMDDHFVNIFVFFTIWSTNGSLLGVHQWFLWVNQWFPCWGEPMASLFGWTNGSFVGVNQWLPSWGAPMVPFLGCTNGSFVGVNQWLPCWGGPKPFSSGWRLAAGAFFFAPNSVSRGKTPFPSAGGLPQALFYGQKWPFWGGRRGTPRA